MKLELRQLGASTWYVPGRVNVGYYEEEGQGYLIDSGLDDDQERKLLNPHRSEERRVGKECRSRWSPYH